MSLSETQMFGVGDNVLELLKKQKPALKKGAMDVDSAIEILTDVRDAALVANEEQHRAIRQSREATARSAAMSQRYYVTASGFLDMAIAAVSKDSQAAAEIRKLRSRVVRPPRDADASVAVEPVVK